MASQLISGTLLKKLNPQKKQYDVRDSIIKGFLVRVNPSGKKSFFIEYTRGKRYCLGDINVVPLKKARERAQKIKTDYMLQGISPKSNAALRERKITLGEFFERLFKPWAKAHVLSWKDMIGRVEKHFKCLFTLPLEDITTKELVAWRTEKIIEGRLQVTSINKVITYLRSVFNLAITNEIIDVHPFAKIKPLPCDTGCNRYLSDEEEQRLMVALLDRDKALKDKRERYNAMRVKRGLKPTLETKYFGDHLLPAVLLAMNTGLRKGELFAIMRKDIDLGNRSIFIPKTKNRQSKFVLLNDTALKVVSNWLTQTQPLRSQYLFPGRLNPKKPISDVKHSWTAVLAKAEVDIQDFRWHDLRHDFASKCVMAGVDLFTVANLLGHKNISQTKHYAHLAPNYVQQSVGKLDARVAKLGLNLGLEEGCHD